MLIFSSTWLMARNPLPRVVVLVLLGVGNPVFALIVIGLAHY
jgi:hypothetical protein